MERPAAQLTGPRFILYDFVRAIVGKDVNFSCTVSSRPGGMGINGWG